MAREDILTKAETLAAKYERQYGGCAQCVVGALKEAIGGISDDVFKAATGLAGGIGITGNNACGSLTGGVMVLSLYLGREYNNFADPTKIRWETFRLAKKLQERFEKEFGSGICKEIQRKIMGRSYNLWDKKDYSDFLAAGGHDDKCPTVCGKAAKWVIEILQEEKLI
jgi:C_GCAxxG_C_C family probable redox protein